MTDNTNGELDFDDYVFWDSGLFPKVYQGKNGMHISGDRMYFLDKNVKPTV